ncbi:phosphoglycerate mutase-like protein 4 [Phtheirospermum japonicum]|uniref:Phosphoglycerate mutase-like protein 4 n=1 Tax=Phtheirospermum japonicum TaxID=374723 RepID=A0A830CM85_9LAMI|nr:phosphoglycerate mutase-like protein 4 [Phtheirospermum japonicum]
MNAVRLTIITSPRHSFLSSPVPIIPRHLSPLLFNTQNIYQPSSLGFILRKNFMADSVARDEVLAQSDYAENGGTDETIIGPNYAEIIVIRHGETEWNADRRIQGHLDVDLNDVGRQQAVAVAERLSKEPKISAVYSSDLKRAFYTAEIIAK